MEQKPHVPGYGKNESLERELDREMTMEEIEALEVPSVEVVKKGVVHSKVEALKKPDAAAQRQLRESLLSQIDAEMMKPTKTKVDERIRDMKVARLREQMEGTGRAGNA